VKQDAVELCVTSGLMLKDKKDNQDPAYVHMPFSLFPMPYPTDSFLQACEMQKPLGRLISGLLRDPEQNIWNTLAGMRKYDSFMDRLLQISEKLNERRKTGLKTQEIQFCLMRADYIIDWSRLTAEEPNLKLVEFNTIACGMLPVTAITSQLQEYIANKYGLDFDYSYGNRGDSLFYAH
jgi:hypothetical protein